MKKLLKTLLFLIVSLGCFSTCYAKVFDNWNSVVTFGKTPVKELRYNMKANMLQGISSEFFWGFNSFVNSYVMKPGGICDLDDAALREKISKTDVFPIESLVLLAPGADYEKFVIFYAKLVGSYGNPIETKSYFGDEYYYATDGYCCIGPKNLDAEPQFRPTVDALYKTREAQFSVSHWLDGDIWIQAVKIVHTNSDRNFILINNSPSCFFIVRARSEYEKFLERLSSFRSH